MEHEPWTNPKWTIASEPSAPLQRAEWFSANQEPVILVSVVPPNNIRHCSSLMVPSEVAGLVGDRDLRRPHRVTISAVVSLTSRRMQL